MPRATGVRVHRSRGGSRAQAGDVDHEAVTHICLAVHGGVPAREAASLSSCNGACATLAPPRRCNAEFRHAFLRRRLRSRPARTDQCRRPGQPRAVTRFDFKGVDAKFELEDQVINQSAPSDFQLKQMDDILRARLIARSIDARCLEFGDVETNLAGARRRSRSSRASSASWPRRSRARSRTPSSRSKARSTATSCASPARSATTCRRPSRCCAAASSSGRCSSTISVTEPQPRLMNQVTP